MIETLGLGVLAAVVSITTALISARVTRRTKTQEIQATVTTATSTASVQATEVAIAALRGTVDELVEARTRDRERMGELESRLQSAQREIHEVRVWAETEVERTEEIAREAEAYISTLLEHWPSPPPPPRRITT